MRCRVMSRTSPQRMPTPISFEVHLAQVHQLAEVERVNSAICSDSEW
jgi:hypothetical protein